MDEEVAESWEEAADSGVKKKKGLTYLLKYHFGSFFVVTRLLLFFISSRDAVSRLPRANDVAEANISFKKLGEQLTLTGLTWT